MNTNYTDGRFNLAASVSNSVLLVKNSACLLLFLVIAAAATVPARAQTKPETLYSLNEGSSFEQGCFPPCECPGMIDVPAQGTFLLMPTGFDGYFYTYAVRDVNWTVTLGGTSTLVTGSGTYRVGGEVALQQELSLDLQVGEGGKVEHFDSGLVGVSRPVSQPLPTIKLAISINGQVCFDKVFNVSASPMPEETPRGRNNLF
jgi:hypothetical protein